ncbi:DNA polymerase III subunit delta [Granulibacter bethesdensis]|uniref:DNA polymerase III subunit delta n=1 Tax=Granulibacter bethesdensis TaxID=364410 RepID=UPI00090AB42B|nr:DNA polymerase III subunit delta [Granulibacter bethesdensis]APH58286.1 DNA polymerase III, delta subunit [Granulibacter bethesdensis]
MKFDARQAEAFLRQPDQAVRAVLLYGDDHGLVRERGTSLTRLVAGQIDDPFRVIELAAEQAADLPNEMAGLSLTGGRRVIRIREAADIFAAPLQAGLERQGEALVILEAGTLTPRSKLRVLAEKMASAASIACYPDEGRSLSQTIQDSLARDRVSIEADALKWLCDHLGADRALTRREIDKLALYAGQDGTATIEAAQACIGDLAGLSLEDALYASVIGDVSGAERALSLALAEGTTSIAVIRMALQHMQRLRKLRAVMQENGTSSAEAVRQAKPPVFFKRVPAFTKALTLWRDEMLAAICDMLWQAEKACKQSGAPDEIICRQAVMSIALRARQAAARGV